MTDASMKKVVLMPTLAPYKIVLLALIAAYCAGMLPKETHRPLLATIVRYIEGPSRHDRSVKLVSLPTLNTILQEIKDSCLKADEEKGQQYADDIELRLLHALWSLQSLDSLHTFISRSASLLVSTYREGKDLITQMSSHAVPHRLLTKTSFLGSFVLNFLTSFRSLEFDKSELLWRAFVDFRKPSNSKWLKKWKYKNDEVSDAFGPEDWDDSSEVLAPLIERLRYSKEDVKQEHIILSQEDLSSLVDYQVQLLEAYGTPTSPELREILSSMTQQDAGKIRSVHYINYLECLKSADYRGAFIALHRYFDYMMSNKRTVFYHYALLSLATLHAAFDCDGEAIRAIEESISVARENKDVACLNFLLTWLFNFMKDRPNLHHSFYVSNQQLLQFLKTKTAETSTSLHSTSYQLEAAQLMLEGGSSSAIIESLVKSEYISLSNSSGLSAFVTHCLLSSSFWARAGNLELTKIYNDIALNSSDSVILKSTIKIREAHIFFLAGEVERAFEILAQQEEFTINDISLSKELSGRKLLLLATQSLRESNYLQVGIYLKKLSNQQHVSLDFQNELTYLNALYLFRTGNLPESMNIVQQQLRTFNKRNVNKFWYVKFILLYCAIITESSSPVRALSTSIKGLNTASKCGFTVLALEGTLRVCEILLKLGQYDDVEKLLEPSFPNFEQAKDFELKSKAHQLLASALIKKFHSSDYSKQKKIEVITKIVKNLELSIDGFKKISFFREMRDSFELQKEIAQLINHEELLSHAVKSLEVIQQKISQIKLNN